MGRENKLLGASGEKIACGFLKSKGYRILETNYRTYFGELDIIARKGPYTVFVEVKTRATSSLGPPYLNMTWKKKRHIIKNALCYLKRRGRVDSFWRIDVVSVKLGENYAPENIELFENAVTEDDYR
jgi:putative endonuclease